MAVALKSWWIALLVLFGAVSCALPEGSSDSPEGAYYLWLQARQAGDIDACWNAMHPEIRGHLTRWNEVERETLFIVEKIYPKERRPAALEVLEEGGRARLPDAKALFAALLTREAGQALEGLQAYGAGVSSSEVIDEETVELTTRGGNRVTVRRIDDTWSVSLSADKLSKLEKLVAKAEDNLKRVTANKRRLRGIDQGTQAESP